MKSISVKQKLKHLIKKLKFKRDELGEIEKMYAGDFFDENDKGYRKLLSVSSDLCEQFDKLDEQSKQKQGIFYTLKLFIKKRKILKKLFIKNALVNGSRSGLKMVVGLVELDKFCFFNKSVHFSPYSITKCGKNVLFGVNVQVGNDNIERKDNKIK